MNKIRFAEPSDLENVKNAWSVCFDDPKDYVDWNFKYNYDFKTTVAAECDGKFASNMQLVPYDLCINGESIRSFYISGVATLPEFRMRGLVRAQFEFALPEMLKLGAAVTTLIPFKKEFYEKFGYTVVYERHKFKPEKAPQDAKIYKRSDIDGAAKEKLIDTLDRIYRSDLKGKNGYILRTRDNWDRLLGALTVSESGAVALVQNENGYIMSEGNEVLEFHGDLGTEALEAGDRPPCMARVVDAKKVLALSAQSFDGDMTLKIRDDMIAENNKTFRISQKRLEVTDAPADIELDISELTALYYGFKTDSRLGGLFRSRPTYFEVQI